METHNQFGLLAERRFGAFFLTQFLGAFNDNVFKNALLLLIAYQAADQFAASSDTLINLSAGLFVLPFFLFSSLAGQLADKYEKSMLIRQIKLLEIAIMLCAAAALLLDSVLTLIILLFLMGTQSSLFGPVKYGYIPQTVSGRELIGANGLVSMGTFMAILLGTALGGILIGLQGIGRSLVAGAVVLIAVLGYFASRAIPVTAALDPDLRLRWNPFRETWRILAFAASNRIVLVAICGISWFWYVGSIYLAQLPNFTRLYLGGDETVVTLLLTLFASGVGAGALLCERLTRRRVDLAPVPLAMLGLVLLGLDLSATGLRTGGAELQSLGNWLLAAGAWRVVLDVLLLGVAGGLYIVPLYAIVQQRSEPAHRARIIAANNVLNALLMVLAALTAIVLLASGFTITRLFALVAGFNVAVAVLLCLLAPEIWQRFCAWVLRRDGAS